MKKVKARKQGNALMVTLSSELNVSEGDEFYLYQDELGVITLIPKVADIFANVDSDDFDDMDTEDIAKNFHPEGSEGHD